MVVAILLGMLAGLVGFVPLAVGLRMTKRTVSQGVTGSMAMLLLALFTSFVAMFVLTMLFIKFDKSLAFPFVLAEVIVLCVVTIGYGVARMKDK